MKDDVYFREKILELEDRLDSLDAMPEGSVSILARTFAETTYPTSPSSFFACQPVSIDGIAREGGPASLTPDAMRTFHAYNLGTQVPPQGTIFVATSVSGRWVFRHDG